MAVPSGHDVVWAAPPATAGCRRAREAPRRPGPEHAGSSRGDRTERPKAARPRVHAGPVRAPDRGLEPLAEGVSEARGRKWANGPGVLGDRRVLTVAVGVIWGKRALRSPVAALATPLKCHMIVYMTETGESVVGVGVDAADSAINDDAVDGELVTSAVEVAEAWLAQLSDQIAVPASDVQDHLLDLWGVLDEGPAREEVERWLTETLRRNLYSVSDINERLETFLPVG